MDIHEIRRTNLRLLVREHAKGNLAQFVDLADLPSYKALQKVTSPRALRNLGSRLARKIEVQLNLEPGWMDHDHSGTVHTGMVPGGRSERVMQLAESIESLPPGRRLLLEALVKELAKRPSKPRCEERLGQPNVSSADSPVEDARPLTGA